MAKVRKQVVAPESRAFAHSRRLCRLKMRICKRRERLVFEREIRCCLYGVYEQLLYLQKRSTHKYNVRIVADVARRSAEMNYSLRLRAGVAEGLDVRHYVVTHLRLILCGKVVINVVNMRLHLVNLLVSYIETELLFALRKRNPELSPG